MIEALAAIGSGSMLAAIAAIIWLAYKLVRSKDDQLAARDRIDKLDERADAAERGLADETSAHNATKQKLLAEHELRVSAETQRNTAEVRERERIAEQIKSSGVADAVAMLDRLFAQPGVRDEETVPAGDPNTTDDDLLKPGV